MNRQQQEDQLLKQLSYHDRCMKLIFHLIIILFSFICGIIIPPIVVILYTHGLPSQQQQQVEEEEEVSFSLSSQHDYSVLIPLPLSSFKSNNEFYDALMKNNKRVLATDSTVTGTSVHDDTTTSHNFLHNCKQQYPCNDESIQNFLHDEQIKGYHVLCFTQVSDNVNSNNNQSSLYKLTIYRYGTTYNQYTTKILLNETTWTSFQSTIITKRLGIQYHYQQRNQQPHALFTPDGQRIVDEGSVENNNNDDSSNNINDSIPWYIDVMAKHIGMVLFYEGGQFIWPGVRLGYERTVSLYTIMPINSPNMDHKPTVNVTLITLSLSPLVLSVHGFLSINECYHIQQCATPTMEYSNVVLMDHDIGRPASDFRTSQTTFLDSNRDHQDPILTDIDYRTASLIRIPRNHQEPVQVLRYGISEKYSSHHDFFDPKSYQSDIETLQLIQNGKRNRFVTVFWYLSTVEEGGETIFPRAYGQIESSSNDCNTGLKVKPEIGKVIIFYNMKYDGTTDTQSLHGACPVINGTKWAANKWVWNEPMSYVPQ
jgi:prolyl 4-hydroxylase